ncbi:type II toxin-antitoxin system VapC family toxin [Pedobacter panaciterrae]|uniref:Type II toxin-antitoxin system VapC family toxin n=1 Tax=Pedobacter panaciterrae TaxID=363849 RepID=A0ABU8NNK6_9SPHI|nr:type II toxin-antitoxin system VapC family toxin [uncultured Pedobacter sp.]
MSVLFHFGKLPLRVSLGKLELGISYEELQLQAIKNGFEFLPLTFEHSAGLIGLEFHHRDPFDRMIISQAIVKGLTIVGKDQNFLNTL